MNCTLYESHNWCLTAEFSDTTMFKLKEMAGAPQETLCVFIDWGDKAPQYTVHTSDSKWVNVGGKWLACQYPMFHHILSHEQDKFSLMFNYVRLDHMGVFHKNGFDHCPTCYVRYLDRLIAATGQHPALTEMVDEAQELAARYTLLRAAGRGRG